jgi:Glycerate kinase
VKNPIFVLAPDSFKGSMTAKQVCDAMERGIKRIYPEAICTKIPMADGGEGTVQSLVDATGGKIYEERVTDPLGGTVLLNMEFWVTDLLPLLRWLRQVGFT